MRIHSDTLTVTDLVQSAHKANVTFTRNTTHGSKKRKLAYDVILSGNSPFRQNSSSEFTATWDQ